MIWHVWRAHRIAILTQAHIKVSQRPLHPHLCAPLTYLSFLHDQHTTVKYAAHIHTVNQICCTHVQPIYMHMHMHMQSDILHTSIGSQTYCTHVQPDTHAHAHATNYTAHTYTARCTACIHAVRHIAHTFSYCTCMP